MVTRYLIRRVDTVARYAIERAVRGQRRDQVLGQRRSRFRRQAIRKRKERREQAVEVRVDHDLALHVELVLIDIATHRVSEAVTDIGSPADFLTKLLKVVDI